jgi:hypothetical protein
LAAFDAQENGTEEDVAAQTANWGMKAKPAAGPQPVKLFADAPAEPLKNEPIHAPMDGFGPLSMRINQRNPKNFAPETPAAPAEPQIEPTPVAQETVVDVVETAPVVEAPAPVAAAPVFMPFPTAQTAPETPAVTPAPVITPVTSAHTQVPAQPAAPVSVPPSAAEESFEPSFEPTSSDEPDFASILSVQILQTADQSESQTAPASQSGMSMLGNELTQASADPLLDFPSLTELKSLATELMSLNLIDTRVGVGAGNDDKVAQSSSNHEETTKTSD